MHITFDVYYITRMKTHNRCTVAGVRLWMYLRKLINTFTIVRENYPTGIVVA